MAEPAKVKRKEDTRREWTAEEHHAYAKLARRQTLKYVSWVVGLTLLLNGYGFARIEHKGSVADEHIRQSQVEACQDSLKPGGVRYEVAIDKRHQADQNEAFLASGLFYKLFTGVPPEQLKELTEQSINELRASAAKIMDVDCEAIYTKP